MRRGGEVVGQHTGLADYTIGQRKGLGIQSPEPLFVLGMDATRQGVSAGLAEELGTPSLTAARVNWVAGEPPAEPIRADVKIRYKATPVGAAITPLANDRVAVEFDEPLRDITPGQGAIFYHDEVCLGGGIIESPPK